MKSTLYVTVSLNTREPTMLPLCIQTNVISLNNNVLNTLRYVSTVTTQGSSSCLISSCVCEVSVSCSFPWGDQFNQADMNRFRKMLMTASSMGVTIELTKETGLFCFMSVLMTDPSEIITAA